MTLALSIGALTTLFVLGTMVYVAISYSLLRGHAPPRAKRAALAEMGRELLLSILVQPLLPLFYVFGRRLARGTGTPVVVVHGYMQNRVDFLGIARALTQHGLGPVYGFNYPWFASIGSNARRLGRFVDRVRSETGREKVALVCHSMGGLVALDYLLHHAGNAHVSICITIASPHGGVVYKGPMLGAPNHELRVGSTLVKSLDKPLPVPVLSIASTHDNVAHPSAISSIVTRGGDDWVVEGPGHLAILFDRRVIERVVTALSSAS